MKVQEQEVRTLIAETGAVTAVLSCLMNIKCISARLMSVADRSVSSVSMSFVARSCVLSHNSENDVP